MMKMISVVGARPNFMKISPFIKAIDHYNSAVSEEKIDHLLVHTGQHFDDRMSRSFFEELGIPEPDINLGVGSGTHSEQVGYTMIEFEKVLKKEKPDWVVVVGDVNATLACTVTAKKENIKVCHIEAGLRSGDMTMPEEINRLVTDRLSDLLLTPDRLSIENLRKEGIPVQKIGFVGNIMIDTLEANREKASRLTYNHILKHNLTSDFRGNLDALASVLESRQQPFGLMTLHRPSNVDHYETIEPIIRYIVYELVKKVILLWPIHPRTKKQLELFGLWEEVNNCENLVILHPLGYNELLRINMDAKVILTDSGGLQEECTVLGTPCLTMRWNTERPVTLTEHGGASVLVGNDVGRIRKELDEALNLPRNPFYPELWDGKTAERCLRAILEYNE